MNRISREKKTVQAMVRIFCRCRKHAAFRKNLCDSCSSLLVYAHERLDQCVFGNQKPTCAQCPVHCYKPNRRQEITEMMRYSGPKMLLRHPLLAVTHLIDGKKKPGEKVKFYRTKHLNLQSKTC